MIRNIQLKFRISPVIFNIDLLREVWDDEYVFLENFKVTVDEAEVIGRETGVSSIVELTLESFVWTEISADEQEIWLHCDVSKFNL